MRALTNINNFNSSLKSHHFENWQEIRYQISTILLVEKGESGDASVSEGEVCE